MTHLSHLALLLAAGSSLLVSVPAQRPAQQLPASAEFFRPVRPGDTERRADLPEAVRQRNVRLNLGLLEHDEAGAVTTDVTFALFPDLVVRGKLDRIEAAYAGGYVAAFNLRGDHSGHAYISVVGEAATATFRVDGGLIQLHHVGGGVHTISQIDETKHEGCGAGPDQYVRGLAKTRVLTPLRAGLGEIFEVLVVYTDDARAANGGTNGINSLINLAVFETNQGYANSDVTLRMNLVHTAEVSFDETGDIGTWLSELRSTSDGVIDQVHAMRDKYGADAVSMITANSGGACGIGYIMTTLSSGFASNAFTVVHDGCATGYYSFGHEFGHNLGCAHDPDNAGSAVFSYSYGYRTTSSAYRSIMSYAPGTRILFWSNPNKVAPNGEVMGVANAQENYRSINNVEATATAWRAHRDEGHEVTTQFASNNGYAGNMFDVQPKTDITITGVDINTSASSGTSVQARVWYRTGSYVGHDGSSSGWTTLATGSGTSAGQDNPTSISLSNSVTFAADTTYGIYVEYLSYGGSGGSLRYTNGGPTNYENSYVLLTTGVGKGEGFTSSTFTYREWNGTLRYQGANGANSITTTFSSNNGFAGNMFTVTPSTNLTINSFDCNIAGSGYATVDVWYRSGSYTGNENNASGWTFAGSDFKSIASGSNNATRIAVGDIDLNSGTTYSFYVLLASYGGGQSLRYTNGSTTYSNSHMTIQNGIGRGNGSFTGGIFTPRIWNGRIRYTLR